MNLRGTHVVAVRRLVAAAGVALLVGSGACASLAAPAPPFSDPLLEDRHTVDSVAATRIGDAYACAVVTAASDDPNRRLVIYVTSAEGALRAERLRQELGHPDDAAVETIDKRYRASTIQRIRLAVRPPAGVGVGIGEGRMYYERCPRVTLTLLPRGETSPRVERWAKRFRARYGADRVLIARGTFRPR